MKKRCSKCGQDLPLEAFARHRSTPDGLQYHCRECQKLNNARWYQAKKLRERVSLDDLRYRPVEHILELLTCDELARLLGCQRTKATDCQRGYDQLPSDEQDRIARTLQCTLSRQLGG